MNHVYSTSISEVIKNILSITTSNFDLDLQKVIKNSKVGIIDQLIEKLSCKFDEETNMCAGEIISHLLMDHREH